MFPRGKGEVGSVAPLDVEGVRFEPPPWITVGRREHRGDHLRPGS